MLQFDEKYLVLGRRVSECTCSGCEEVNCLIVWSDVLQIVIVTIQITKQRKRPENDNHFKTKLPTGFLKFSSPRSKSWSALVPSSLGNELCPNVLSASTVNKPCAKMQSSQSSSKKFAQEIEKVMLTIQLCYQSNMR